MRIIKKLPKWIGANPLVLIVGIVAIAGVIFVILFQTGLLSIYSTENRITSIQMEQMKRILKLATGKYLDEMYVENRYSSHTFRRIFPIEILAGYDFTNDNTIRFQVVESSSSVTNQTSQQDTPLLEIYLPPLRILHAGLMELSSLTKEQRMHYILSVDATRTVPGIIESTLLQEAIQTSCQYAKEQRIFDSAKTHAYQLLTELFDKMGYPHVRFISFNECFNNTIQHTLERIHTQLQKKPLPPQNVMQPLFSELGLEDDSAIQPVANGQRIFLERLYQAARMHPGLTDSIRAGIIQKVIQGVTSLPYSDMPPVEESLQAYPIASATITEDIRMLHRDVCTEVYRLGIRYEGVITDLELVSIHFAIWLYYPRNTDGRSFAVQPQPQMLFSDLVYIPLPYQKPQIFSRQMGIYLGEGDPWYDFHHHRLPRDMQAAVEQRISAELEQMHSQLHEKQRETAYRKIVHDVKQLLGIRFY
jgi:hypothetical protein